MNSSIKTHSGEPGMPAVILIHGLGMNNYFWMDPGKCLVLGGLAPLTIFLAEPPEEPQNTLSFGSVAPHVQGLWSFLKSYGFSLASWSQSKPLGPIQIAISELKTAVEVVKEKWPDKPLYLVGHSRGGLIARQYILEESPSDIKGLITICSPHKGTDIAKFSRYLKPAGVLLEKILPDKSKANLTKALNHLATFFKSPAIEELTPGSQFMASVNRPLPKSLSKLSFGGTSPALFQLIVNLPPNYQKVIKFPDLFIGAVPGGHIPRELTPGLGDALVSAESAKLSGSKHFNFPDNHVKAAYNHQIHAKVVAFMHP